MLSLIIVKCKTISWSTNSQDNLTEKRSKIKTFFGLKEIISLDKANSKKVYLNPQTIHQVKSTSITN